MLSSHLTVDTAGHSNITCDSVSLIWNLKISQCGQNSYLNPYWFLYQLPNCELPPLTWHKILLATTLFVKAACRCDFFLKFTINHIWDWIFIHDLVCKDPQGVPMTVLKFLKGSDSVLFVKDPICHWHYLSKPVLLMLKPTNHILDMFQLQYCTHFHSYRFHTEQYWWYCACLPYSFSYERPI